MAGIRLSAPVPLTDAHEFAQFNCGNAALDDWLHRRARANQVSGASRTYVVTEGGTRVAGYYALASGALAAISAPGKLKRNMPDPIPMAVLGRLAIDRAFQGQGLGAAMLQDAVLRVRTASAILGIRGILVHAISSEAKAFYEHHGFAGTAGTPMTLVLSLG